MSPEGTFERAVEEAWYPDEINPLSVGCWNEEDAHKDYFLLRTEDSYFLTNRARRNRSLWRLGAKRAKKVIRARLGEALISEAAYLRAYAKLILEEGARSHESNGS